MAVPTTPPASVAARQTEDRAAQQSTQPSPMKTAWSAVSAGIGTLTGFVPHVLHHVTLLAGAAFVTGLLGNLLFGLVGLALSVPLLRRLYRRFHTWRAPAIAVVAFVVAFSISALVIGPALLNTDTPSPGDAPAQVDHEAHHRS
jgi:hypothetical protein